MGRKKGIILSYVLMILEVLSTLLLTPFIIRSLGPSEYGVYKLSASIVAYIALLDLGIGNAIVRFTAKYNTNNEKLQMNRFLGVAQMFYGIMGVAAMILGCVLVAIFPVAFAEGLTQSEIALGQILLFITVVNAAVTLFTAAYPNILIGYGLFGISKGLSIVQIIIRIVVTYVCLKLGFKSIAIVSVNLILTTLNRLISAIYVFAKLKLKPILRGVDKSFVKEIVAYSGFILLQMIATQINAFADQVLIGMFVKNASTVIAVYSVGAQIVQYFQSIGGAVSGVLMPGVVSMVERGATSYDLEKEMVKIGRLSLIILGTIFGGFVVFGKQFIHLWVGKDFNDGFYVALMLMFAQLVIYVESIGSQILWAKNEHKEQSILKFVVVLVNVVLTILLIKWNPLIGATLGTFISLILGDVIVMNIVFKKKINIKIGRYYRSLFKGLIPALTLATLLSFAFSFIGLSGWIGFSVNIVIYCVLAMTFLALFGFNKYEKTVILQFLRPIIGFLRKREK